MNVHDRVFFVISALLAAMLLTMLINVAKAQACQTELCAREIYGANGRIIGRTTTDSQGTTTVYGSDGKPLTRESPTSQGSTIYDAKTGKPIAKTGKDKH